MRTDDVLLMMIIAWVLTLFVFFSASCAPQGYIDGQSACQLENEQLRQENQEIRDKYVRYQSPDEGPIEEAQPYDE